MIKVNRSRIQEPSILINDNKSNSGEKYRAINHVEIQGLELKDFKFSLYKDEEIKEGLKELFHGKCAYCESIFIHNAYGQIEHWRPKKGVTENTNHSGYYWLASDWENLLWACPVCNSKGNKGNHFPLFNSSSYALKSSDDINKEQPLLINPCNDNPISHLEYNEEGFIKDKTPMGKKSIEIYGLDRPDLTAERIKMANEIRRNIRIIIKNIDSMSFHMKLIQEGNTSEELRKVIDDEKIIIDDAFLALKDKLNPSSEFVGMNKFLINMYKEKYQENEIFLKLTNEKLGTKILQLVL
ncbi:hypothetical protein CN481_22065 [Bacillus sp. AFS006103]|nr:hypothetical protein CN481_22065 [Bacillus sp. AFS006103]